MSFTFEFDAANKILLCRVAAQLTDELLAECYAAIRKYSEATDACIGIFDLSSVSQFAVSSEFIRQLAKHEPAMPDAATRLRIIAVENTTGFGLARMFQIVGEKGRPMATSALPTSSRRSIASSREAALTAEKSPSCQRQMNKGIDRLPLEL